MAPRDDGRVVVLTGANRGIGFHMTTALLDDGYRVAALDVDVANLHAVRDDSPAGLFVRECDVTDAGAIHGAIEDVIERWGSIDILVNNAAIATLAGFETQSDADLRRQFEVNVFGYTRTIRAVLPHMRARDRGIIHNLGSATADVGHPGLAGYAATKGAIKALTRSLRLELRECGIACTLMIPPTTETRMTAGLRYPGWMTSDPATVGRQLADKIESTRPVITPDWGTALGIAAIRHVPRLWALMTAQVVDLEDHD